MWSGPLLSPYTPITLLLNAFLKDLHPREASCNISHNTKSGLSRWETRNCSRYSTFTPKRTLLTCSPSLCQRQYFYTWETRSWPRQEKTSKHLSITQERESKMIHTNCLKQTSRQRIIMLSPKTTSTRALDSTWCRRLKAHVKQLLNSKVFKLRRGIWVNIISQITYSTYCTLLFCFSNFNGNLSINVRDLSRFFPAFFNRLSLGITRFSPLICFQFITSFVGT